MAVDHVLTGSSPVKDMFVSGFRDIDSSLLYSMYYVSACDMLEISFRRSGSVVYQYYDFRPGDYARLLEAYKRGDSLGAYYNSAIKGKFPCACALPLL